MIKKITLATIMLLTMQSMLRISFSQPLSYTVIEWNNSCRYIVHDFTFISEQYMEDTSNTYTGQTSYYSTEDSIPSIYGGMEKRKEFARVLDYLLKDEDMPIAADRLRMQAEYFFPEAPDFILLEYFSPLAGGNTFYIGIDKSNDNFYQLNGFNRGKMLKKNFNRMNADNPDILPISDICLAKLLIKLHVGDNRQIVFVESAEEAVISDLIFSCEICGLPGFDIYNNALYLDNLKDNGKLISGYDKCLEMNDEYKETAEANSTVFEQESGIDFKTIISETSQGTDIYLTAISINRTLFSTTVTDHISRWQVSLDKDGKINSIGIVGEEFHYRLSPCRFPIPGILEQE